jgi:hypothetical protein
VKDRCGEDCSGDPPAHGLAVRLDRRSALAPPLEDETLAVSPLEFAQVRATFSGLIASLSEHEAALVDCRLRERIEHRLTTAEWLSFLRPLEERLNLQRSADAKA